MFTVGVGFVPYVDGFCRLVFNVLFLIVRDGMYIVKVFVCWQLESEGGQMLIRIQCFQGH